MGAVDEVVGTPCQDELAQLTHVFQTCSGCNPGVRNCPLVRPDLTQSQLANAIDGAKGDGHSVQSTILGVLPALLLSRGPAIEMVSAFRATTEQQVVLILVGNNRLVLGMEEDGVPHRVATQSDVQMHIEAHVDGMTSQAPRREPPQQNVLVKIDSILDRQRHAEGLILCLDSRDEGVISVTEREFPAWIAEPGELCHPPRHQAGNAFGRRGSLCQRGDSRCRSARKSNRM